MYLSSALTHNQFYVLLALSRGNVHGYELFNVAHNDSLGSVRMSKGRVYSTLKEMIRLGLVAEAGEQETGKQGKPRMLYSITPEGKVRLKDDLKRMRHAVGVGEHAGLFFDEIPADIQRIINKLR